MEALEVLRCPKTGNKLRFDDSDSVVLVEDSAITYPVVDGIVDFCHERRDFVSESYDRFAPSYDSYMTSPNIFMKLFGLLFWGSWDETAYTEKLFSYLPRRFEGILLDVPAGTGVFTDSLYTGYPDATIIGIDYSMGMLQEARKRFEERGLNNIRLVRADVANLPLADGAVDIVLSMAGLHAFPDKKGAVAEMRRVLRTGGALVGSSYVKGIKRRWDFIVKHYGVRKGWFTPPFLSAGDISSHFEGFTVKRQENVEGGVCFEVVKEC